jgi:hypothetical protein
MPVPHSETFGKQASPPKTTSDLKLDITRVTPLWPRKVYVQWILRNPKAATGYSFRVSRSASPNGPWELLTTAPLLDTYWYLDNSYPADQDRTTPGLQQLRGTFYYKVTANYSTDTPVEQVRNVDGELDHRRQGIFRKLTRDAYLMLSKGNGTEVAVLKRMWYGAACTCRASTGQVTRAHCSLCNGTGIVKGYWDPVYTYARRSATPMDSTVNSAGRTDANRLTVTLPYFPEIAVEDVLVFLRDNRRYMIEKINQTELQAVAVHQEVEVSELARNSREYAMKVDPWRTPQWF